ncbi:uridine kinase [Glutamicibacter sp. NPDC087344]|uniref:uridine kinase n=1 Tax=Glutamicibacter sp. NPDC087344 TaxID=3363994 RepID=UPI0037F38FAD
MENESMEKFMKALADSILGSVGPGRRIVAIDGVDGSGKTTFAANLAAQINERPVITVHVDDFLNPASIRHFQGRTSPQGFWEDTYNYESLINGALVPLGVKGDGWYSPASYDAQRDEFSLAEAVRAPSAALILVEGMFLHRDELVAYWDCSVFLDVPFEEAAARMAIRKGSNADPEHPTMNRYVGGQRLYFEAAHPWERATYIVDNTDYSSPKVIDVDTA